MSLIIKPIGVIKTPFKSKDKIPIQSSKSDTIAEAEILTEYSDGLDSLDGFSHAILLYWFHRAQPTKLRVTPFLDTKERGLFSTRAPSRPNPIGFSIVKIIQVKGNILRFMGADMLNDTPLIDIKPFVPEFDNRLDASSGWLTDSLCAEKHDYLSDDRFLD
ncbi:MAG: tRNA (N6-threonylcarbamoyladenosine(37)-N6)-methyltransferase TrmO [Candidatus Thorarchaeota archaeon]|jgi:tRNA-Thr(GGU) m(6)t(6)A37 methyltransferase TsaA